MAPPNITLRGIRKSIPSGYMLGRKSGGRGGVELISIADVVQQGQASGGGGSTVGSAGTGVGTNGQVWATVAGVAQWSFSTLITALGTITSGIWRATKIELLYGGTNADLSATGGASKFLRQNSAGAAIDVVQPDFSDLASTLGSHLAAGTGISLSGTTTVTITATGGGTGTVTHTVGGLTLHAPVVGNGSADIKTLAAMTDGQVMIGSTGNDPVLTTLTAGANITITNAAGSVTIAAAGGGGGGTVTSVGMTVPTGLSVSGSPVTISGTLAVTWSGLIPLAQGGTHVDLTATGPGYLKQASAGASVTVASTIPYSDVTGGPAASAGADWDAYVQGAFGVGAFGSGGFGSLNLENANNGQLQQGAYRQVWKHLGPGAVPNWETLSTADLSDFATWATDTPTVTAGSGTFTTVSGTQKWIKVGKIIHVIGSVTITTNGTAATSIQVTLPSTGFSPAGTIFATAMLSTGAGAQGNLGGSTINFFKYDSTYPGGTGINMFFSYFYEVS